MNFQELLNKKVETVEKIVMSYLPKEEGMQSRIMEAMNYSVLAGGKRLRPLLLSESFQM